MRIIYHVNVKKFRTAGSNTQLIENRFLLKRSCLNITTKNNNLVAYTSQNASSSPWCIVLQMFVLRKLHFIQSQKRYKNHLFAGVQIIEEQIVC